MGQDEAQMGAAAQHHTQAELTRPNSRCLLNRGLGSRQPGDVFYPRKRIEERRLNFPVRADMNDDDGEQIGLRLMWVWQVYVFMTVYLLVSGIV